jgi:glutamyl-tRNA synthetase
VTRIRLAEPGISTPSPERKRRFPALQWIRATSPQPGCERSAKVRAVSVRPLLPVGRLAPSPTGYLHLGHARTFLLAWWHARSRGGRVLLRLEDLDGPRVKSEAMDAALRDLEWLGLDWDGPPLVQSTGIERHRAALAELQARGLAYPCICTRGDVRTAQSAPQLGVAEVRYPGTCRGRFRSMVEAEQRTGRRAGLRFLVPAGVVRVVDECAPPVDSDVQAEVGDFLIARREGAPAYQLAVVVDDAHQGVNQVVRGDDLLPSTARQWHLQRALGLPHPAWVHVPLVVDTSGRRLAKRAEDLSLIQLRSERVDPRAIVAWAAKTAGQLTPPRITARELVASFELARLPRTRVVLDQAELGVLRSARMRE